MITIKNTFHNSEARVRVSLGEELTVSQTKRAARQLCGVSDCTCGAFHRDPDLCCDYTNEVEGVFLPTFISRMEAY